jgi:hypothetical protein
MSFMASEELKGRGDTKQRLAPDGGHSDGSPTKARPVSGQGAKSIPVDLANLTQSNTILSTGRARLRPEQEAELIKTYAAQFTPGSPVDVANEEQRVASQRIIRFGEQWFTVGPSELFLPDDPSIHIHCELCHKPFESLHKPGERHVGLTESVGKEITPNQPRVASSTISTISPLPTSFEFESAVYPPASLLNDYVIYAREQVESADSYIVGAILPVVAACLARRVYFKWGDEKIYPNVFMMLAGKAGDRKSSAVTLAENLAKAVLPPEHFLPPVCSSESLLDEYDQGCGGSPDKLLMLDEGNILLSNWTESGYGQRVGQQFLRLYDCKDLVESFQKNKKGENTSGRRRIAETSTSVALGATLDVCRLQGRAISSGLQRRFLYYAAEKHGRFIPCPPESDAARLDYLAEQFRKLRDLEVECRFTPTALRVWQEYQRHNRELLELENKEELSARLNGAPRAVQKIAMIFEAACWVIAKDSWKGFIRETTLELAIRHVERCLETASKLDMLAKREQSTVSAGSLLARIRQDFGGKQSNGVIALTKSDLTAKYAPHSDRPHAWKPADLYDRFIPVLMQRGLARLGGKDGKKVWYEFVVEDV